MYLGGWKMRHRSFLAITAGIAALLGGCGLVSGGDSSTAPSPSASVAVAPVASPGAKQSPGQGFPQPTVQQKGTPKGNVPPDLISSTDPNQRLREIQSNRSDPFSLISTTPSVQFSPNPTAAVPPPPALTNPGGSAAPAGGGSNGGGQPNSQRPGRLAPVPSLVPRGPVVPPRPQPNEARAVSVTGVVQVGGEPYAIVKAPDEPTSRYVKAGQRLSNGKILVRQINVNGAEPSVVLEQYGIEVVRAVGEGGATASNAPAGAPAAPNPAASPSNPPTT